MNNSRIIEIYGLRYKMLNSKKRPVQLTIKQLQILMDINGSPKTIERIAKKYKCTEDTIKVHIATINNKLRIFGDKIRRIGKKCYLTSNNEVIDNLIFNTDVKR